MTAMPVPHFGGAKKRLEYRRRRTSLRQTESTLRPVPGCPERGSARRAAWARRIGPESTAGIARFLGQEASSVERIGLRKRAMRMARDEECAARRPRPQNYVVTQFGE